MTVSLTIIDHLKLWDALKGKENGGGQEIRTLEGLPLTRFPSVRLRPLGQSSAKTMQDF